MQLKCGSKEWLECADLLQREMKSKIWIPLWWYQEIKAQTPHNSIGYWEDVVFANAIMADEEYKDELLATECSDYNPYHTCQSCRFRGVYTRGDMFYSYGADPIGERLVIYQDFGRKAEPRVYLNNDLLNALALVQEGDNWLRPDEGYEVAVRQYRDKANAIYKVEINSKFLLDYLCARGKGIAIGTYHERRFVFGDKPNLKWKDDDERRLLSDSSRWDGYINELDSTGNRPGGMVIDTFGCTEAPIDVDVPVVDPVAGSNKMYSERTEIAARPVAMYVAVGELRRIEWLAPGATSTRVGGDKEKALEYYADASGVLIAGDELVHPLHWLWFKGDVINRILALRGSSFVWHTGETGSIGCNTDYMVHFGINNLGLVNVLAKDIVELPRWQQDIWKSYNVTPDGCVSTELLDAQVRVKPAHTIAPEKILFDCIRDVNEGVKYVTGAHLFSGLPEREQLERSIHRFLVQKDADVCLLSHHINKDIIESINKGVLRNHINATKEDQKLGSIKLIERFVEKYLHDKNKARGIVASLAFVYDLRISESHKGSDPDQEIREALDNLKIDWDLPPASKGCMIILRVAKSFYQILEVLRAVYAEREGMRKNSSVRE